MERMLRVVAMVAVTVVALLFGAWARAAVSDAGSLSVSGNQDGVLVPVAASADEVVVEESGTEENGNEGSLAAPSNAAYVFSEPAAGWSSEIETATLTDSGGSGVRAGRAAISGSTIVVNESEPGVPGFLDVFVEPSGGWSGSVQQSARLTASGAASVSEPAVSGQTVVAQSAAGSLSVFTEPAGGWSGTVHEVAKLTDSQGAGLGSPAISGQTIIGVGSNRLDAFAEPAGGWSGSLHESESATLEDQGGSLTPIVVSGSAALASFDVFNEPGGGWTGDLQPAASLFPSGPSGSWSMTAFDGETAAASTFSLGTEHVCPCQGAVSLFSEPDGGWSGAIVGSPPVGVVTASGPVTAALADHALFLGGWTTVSVLRLTGTLGQTGLPPALTDHVALGLGTGHPVLRFKLSAGANAAPLKSFVLGLPNGLRFSKKHRQLRRAVSITGSRSYTISLEHRQLGVTLKGQSARIAVTIGRGALVESHALLDRIANANRRHRAVHVRFNVTVNEALGLSKAVAFQIGVH